MSKLGYTWYPQDWWTSETFKRLKRFPMVRYVIRELFDLMYKEGEPIEMNRDYLIDDFNINLSDDEYEKLLQFIEIKEDGKWWIESIKKRLTKAESARENGKNGGRPKGSKKPETEPEEKNPKTQEKNPKNPPLEKEREIESKIEIESKDEDEKEAEEIFDIDAELFVYKSKFFQNYESFDFETEFQKLENDISNSENENQKLFSSQCLNFLREEQRKKVAPKKENLHQEYVDELKISSEWLGLISMQNKNISTDSIISKLDEFSKHLKTSFKTHKTKTDFVNHFKSWLPKKIPDKSNQVLNHNR